MNRSHHVMQKTLTGTVWNYGIFMLSKGGIFFSTLILARLLSPQDFGLLALGLLAISYFEILSDCGVGAALIYRSDDPERMSSVAFGLNVSLSLLLTLLTFISAPTVAAFFNEPRLLPIIRVLALSLLLAGLRNIHESRLKKELDFRRRLIPEIGKTLAKGGVSVGLAWYGFGVWSLVWGQLSGALTSTLLYWYVSRWSPHLVIDFKLTRSLLGYGVHIVLIGILGTLINSADTFIIGHRMDAAQLGYYTLALQLPQLVVMNLCYIVSQSLFPAYAKLQHDTKALQAGFFLSLRYLSLLTVPMGLGLYLIAPELIQVFYTARWSPVIPIMQLLALHSVIYSLMFNAGDLYKATGHPGILNQINLIKLPLTVSVLWLAADGSIYRVACAQTLIALTFTILQLIIASRILDVRLMKIITAFKPTLIGAAIMFAGTSAIRASILESSGPIWKLVVSVITSCLLYSLSLWLIDRSILQRLLAAIKVPRPHEVSSEESVDMTMRSAERPITASSCQ